MNKSEEFFDGLIGDDQELKKLYDDHIIEYDELLPHVLMGDVTRLVIDRATRFGNQHAVELQRILDYFERALLGSDEEIANLIVISFLENLEQSDESYRVVKSLLGKEMKRYLSLIEASYS